MTRRFFIFDSTRCFGCAGCVAACANANGTVPETAWRNLHKLPPEDRQHDTVYLSIACNHCADPPCARAGPAEARLPRTEAAAGLRKPDPRAGCRYGRRAWPYHEIRWDDTQKVVRKCHFCHERLARGEDPACVATCFAGAITQQAISSGEEPQATGREMLGFTHHREASPSLRFAHRKRGK